MTKKIAVIDVGGTSIKHAIYDQGQLIEQGAIDTPSTLEAFYQQLTDYVHKAKANHHIVGVGMSIPGAVDKKSGVIGGASAIAYIHHFNIADALTKRFGLPITLENDANSAALAEITYGSAKDYQNVLFVVVGTGIGGAVVVNGEIQHGKHLLGGEFGFMLMDDATHILSEVGTAVSMADRYNARSHTQYSGKEIFELADAGDAVAIEERELFFMSLAKGLYNLQYIFDPEKIVLAGGVSQADFLLPELSKKFDVIAETINQRFKQKMGVDNFIQVMPELLISDFKDEANLMGAAADFLRTHPTH